MSAAITRAVVGLIGLAAATAAHAAPTPPGAATPVAPVDVVASKVLPSVVSTYPADGSKPAPGTVVVKATFDRKVAPDGWRFVTSADGEFPQCLPTPRLLADQTTLVVLCVTQPGKAYAVAVKPAPLPGAAEPAASAPAFQFRFTTAGPPVRTLEDALKAASLRPEDSPLMDLGEPIRVAGAAPAPPAAASR